MTPEEKLLALIQQDKRQAGSITPQEKLLELIEQDKRTPQPAPPAPPVVVAAPAPAVVKPTPALVPPTPLAAPVKAKPSVVAPPADVAPPVTAKKTPLAVATPPPAVAAATAPAKPLAKEAPATVAPARGEASPPAEVKKAPLVVAAPAPVNPRPVAAATKTEIPVEPAPVKTQPSNEAKPVPSALPVTQPMLFPTVRVSGVTITSRVLAVMVVALIIMVFYSVAGTQRSISKEIKRQMSGAGEMSVTPMSISDGRVPAMEVFVEKASTRNFFAYKVIEKGKDGAEVPVTVGLSKDFKLVAVSMDPATVSESMAIIKSKADSKTYFVKIGESVGDTGFVLTKVLADRIVLKQRKQEFELK